MTKALPLLTLLIPNYNRPKALKKLIESFYVEIDKNHLSDQINVVVVDDFSTENIDLIVADFSHRTNFYYFQQSHKCGNAERAFLSGLSFVKTEYVWLFGNDDVLLSGALLRVLAHLKTGNFDFLLLNPLLINREAPFVAIKTLQKIVEYPKTEQLFHDFGFMSFTTTFSCLVMRTEPIRNFYTSHDLTKVAAVYSHTFSLYASFKERPGAFLQEPCVAFTMSEANEEQQKLQKQAPDNIMFYHQTLGLVRLIRETSALTGASVEWFGRVIEDEVNKDTFDVYQIPLSFLILRFLMEQLTREQMNNSICDPKFSYLSRSEILEFREIFKEFSDPVVLSFFETMLAIYSCQATHSKIKVAHLKLLQDQVQRAGLERAASRYFFNIQGIKRVSPGGSGLFSRLVNQFTLN